ncbi:DUF1232 domain-containing protein [Marinobacter sp. MW3]|nr:DUF1232 domain-containing protein [Marinobacter sp. MC3]MBL3895819.1 DUF1232 domain-containing protein [Marinobacter sp. MW3]
MQRATSQRLVKSPLQINSLKNLVRSAWTLCFESGYLTRPRSLIKKLKAAALRVKNDALTTYFVARDPNTPIVVRLLALAIAAYAMSPVDLIPDFIPIVGYLDDIILLPLGIMLVIRLTPTNVIEASRAKAAEVIARPVSHTAAVVIVVTWVLYVSAFGFLLWDGVEP